MELWQKSVEARLGQLHKDIVQVRTDLTAEIRATRAELKPEIAESANSQRLPPRLLLGIMIAVMGGMLAKSFGWL